jgi:16S rRNA (cytosine967-C5)-methyltransferase
MAGFESFLLRLSLEVIRDYDFSVPLHRWLVTYFRENKKLGSRDRRGIRELVYSYFRIGKCLAEESEIFRMQTALFLTQFVHSGFIKELLSDSIYAGEDYLALEQRIDFVVKNVPSFDVGCLFPFESTLSAGVNRNLLQVSQLQQPLVWIRIRPEFINQVNTELALNDVVPAIFYAPGILGLPQALNLDQFKTYAKGYFEIQDLSSQLTADLYQPKAGESWWDCCAASGGKSLLLLDRQPDIRLTVSDIRRTSLQSLTERFKRNGYRTSNMFVADLSRADVAEIENRKFDGVLVDAPCSGSGTWGRTPEMAVAFNENQLPILHQVQRTILTTASKFVRPGGKLIYITCSVFAAENEEVVNALVQQGGFRVDDMQLFQSAANRADTLFATRLIRTE